MVSRVQRYFLEIKDLPSICHVATHVARVKIRLSKTGAQSSNNHFDIKDEYNKKDKHVGCIPYIISKSRRISITLKSTK